LRSREEESEVQNEQTNEDEGLVVETNEERSQNELEAQKQE